MASDSVTVDFDQFATTIQEITGRLGKRVEDATPRAVSKALKTGKESWQTYAGNVLSDSYVIGGWGDDRYGRRISTGEYAGSIQMHMMRGGKTPEGEVGSPTLPGLAHLLELGHAKIGGGRTRAFKHIEPAYERAMSVLESEITKAVEEAINDA